MNVTLNTGEHELEIRIDGALTIMEAAETRDQIALGLTTSNGPVTLDLSGVTEVDSAGLQLLLALARESRQVSFSKPSAPLIQLFSFLSLENRLSLLQGVQHGS